MLESRVSKSAAKNSLPKSDFFRRRGPTSYQNRALRAQSQPVNTDRKTGSLQQLQSPDTRDRVKPLGFRALHFIAMRTTANGSGEVRGLEARCSLAGARLAKRLRASAALELREAPFTSLRMHRDESLYTAFFFAVEYMMRVGDAPVLVACPQDFTGRRCVLWPGGKTLIR